MKRSLLLFLTLLFLLCATGCAPEEDPNTVSFHYLRPAQDYLFREPDGVIAPELRTVSDPGADLRYLLGLYLEGPVSEDLISPFPEGTRVLEVTQEQTSLTVELSGEAASLAPMEKTLAWACIAATCFDLTDAQILTILCENETFTCTRDSFLLIDEAAAETVQ